MLLGLVSMLEAGCSSPDNTVSVRFSRPEVQQVVQEVRLFVFGPDGAGVPPSCARFEPRGARFGDAEVRSGLQAETRRDADAEGNFGALPGFGAGRRTVVIEAWSPRCADVDTNINNATFCRRTETGPSTVLRGYFCQPFNFSDDQGLDIQADLRPLAELGSVFQLPVSPDLDNPSNPYGEDAPQPVVETVPARFPYRVQLIDERSNDANDVAVHWEVVSGRGSVDESAVRSGTDPVLQTQGTAQAVLTAGLGAAAEADGRVVVSAYAPGYENAPLSFYARAVPGVRVELQQVDLPREVVDLESASIVVAPSLYADLNGDGRSDFVTVTGEQQHRLVVLYDQGPAGFTLRVSNPVAGQARALAVVGSGQNLPTLLVSSARHRSSRFQGTPDGTTYIVEDPVLELWTGLREIGSDLVLPSLPRVVTALEGAALTKVAISIDAADIDEDGYDELVMSRCSYLVRGGGVPQDSFVQCFGASVVDRSDSELLIATPARRRKRGDRRLSGPRHDSEIRHRRGLSHRALCRHQRRRQSRRHGQQCGAGARALRRPQPTFDRLRLRCRAKQLCRRYRLFPELRPGCRPLHRRCRCRYRLHGGNSPELARRRLQRDSWG